MKYMHNIPESYKEIILLAIISHLTESLKAHSTIHQAQTYPSEYVCIALKKRAKRSPGSSQEHSTLPHSPHGHTGASQVTCRPSCSKTSQAQLLPSKTASQHLSHLVCRASHSFHSPRVTVSRHSFGLNSQALLSGGAAGFALGVCSSQRAPCSIWEARAIKYLTYWTKVLPAKRNSN